ncbi:Endonuclease/exonuclease/phosphatase [Blakeslea trispora]|nr:Endonuclease/exonuclease/phosphatase [Blakeslea trispora]
MLPKPGEIIIHDYRPEEQPTPRESLKVLQWNVERNYESEAIIKAIRDLDPDVVLLQEVDILCKRSGDRDHMEELCKSLKLLGGFLCEFEELDSPVRSLRDQGGGVHGNAILSKYDVDFRVLAHRKTAFDWSNYGHSLKEPRRGQRSTLVGTVKAPSLPPIVCYCVHLEVFTGIIDRISNFSDIFEDAASQADKYPHQIIGGDLNTMAHSIVRLSPKYARDRYRFMSLGDTESNWFDRHVMAVYRDPQHEYNLRLAAAGFPFSMAPVRVIRSIWRLLGSLKLFEWISGFDLETLKRARNPGFYDPWDPDEITLHNPDYFQLFKAKLDWTMVRCMDVRQKMIGNRNYNMSDHAYLMVKVTPDAPEKIANAHEVWKMRRKQWQPNGSAPYWRTTIGVSILLLVLTLFSQWVIYLTG